MKTINTLLYKRPDIQDELVTPAQDEMEDIKYQDILYYILNDTKHINDIPIDLATAKDEIMTIAPWPQFDHFIGFYKKKTRDTIQILRRDENLWYMESIITGHNFKGWFWCCRVDTQTMMGIIEKFFEGDPFMDTANWAVRYIEGYDDPVDVGV